MPGLSCDQTTELAEALVSRVREHPFKLINNERNVKITFSVGVSHYPEDTDDPHKLFENADHAAYIAKKNGRDRVINYRAGVKNVLDPHTLYQYFPCARLIGRDKLLNGLTELLLAPASEPRPWVFLAGPPGVGKTRFLLELRNRVDTQRGILLETVGLPVRASQPFGFIVDALGKYMRDNPQAGQQMCGVLDPMEIATLAKLLPDLSRHALLSPGSDGVSRQPGEFDPVKPFCKMLGVLSGQRPLVILLDDFQLADQGSMRLLERLRDGDPSVFVCLAVRDDEETLEKNGILAQFMEDVVRRGAAQLKRLEPFSVEQVQELIEAVIPDANQYPDLGELVHEKSRGLPLLIEEILKLLIYSESIRYEGSQLIVSVSSDQIPTDADTLLQVRAGQVDDDVRILMAHAAVIGPEFDFSTLMMLEERDEGYLRGIMERARKAHIVSEEWSESSNRISFISVHTHAAFYRALDDDERRKLHLKLGRQRERQYASQLDAALSELAFHFNRAGETERAQQYRKMVNELYSQFVGQGELLPLGSDAMKHVMGHGEVPDEVLRTAMDVLGEFKICLQKMRMYGPDHLTRQGNFENLAQHFAELHAHLEAVTYSEADRNILVNGTLLPVSLSHGSTIVDTFINYDIRALTFNRGLSAADLRACLDFLTMHKEDLRGRGGLGKLLRDVGITTIVPNEKMYVLVGQRDIVLKRTNIREEVLIKEIGEEPRGFSAPASPTPVPAPTTAPPPAVASAIPEDIAQWQREMARYVDLKLLNNANKDWRILQRDLESGSRIKIMAASKVYVEARTTSIDPLLELIGTTEDARARRVAVSLLNRVTHDGRELILRRLFEATLPQQKCAYISALDEYNDAAVATEVECFLRHPDRQVRLATISLIVAKACGTLGSVLLRAMEAEDNDVRLDLVAAMGENKLETTVPLLIKILQKTSIFTAEGSTRLQAAACIALGRIGNVKFMPYLLEVLERSSGMQRTKPSVVRAAAATALQYLVTPLNKARILTELTKYERDADPMVAAAASKAAQFLNVNKASSEPTAQEPPPIDTGKRLLTSNKPAHANIRWRGIRS